MSEQPVSVEREIFVRAGREEVFQMFIEPARLAAWLGVSAELDAVPGGRFRFEVSPGEFCSGHYVVVEPPARVAFTWGWESGAIPVEPGSTLVDVELIESEGGTLVRLSHSQLPLEVADLHDDGWRQYLERLAAVLEGRTPGPDPARERPAEALQRLAAKGSDD